MPLDQQHWFVAVGASGSDGFLSIQHLLRELPPLPNATILIVLHRQSNRPSNLAELLARHASMPLTIATNFERFKRGFCYVGEPDKHLTLASHRSARLVPDRFANQHRNRSVDLLFSSVAEHARANAIGVVLPGSLDDGSRGLAAINHVGGLTMVTTPTHSDYGDMPRNAITYAGIVDLIGSVTEIATGIASAVSGPEMGVAVAGSGRL